MKKILALLAGSAILLTANAVSAAGFINGSFEDATKFAANSNPGDDELAVGSTDMPGWTVTGKTISWNSYANPYSVTASPGGGSYFLDLSGLSDGGTYGGVSQTFTTDVGATYQVKFDLGSSYQYGTPVQMHYSAGDVSGTATSVNGTGYNVWEAETFSFVATSAATTLAFIGGSPSNGSNDVGLDNVTVTQTAAASAVPEPASWAMMILGIGAVGYAVRSGKRRSDAKFDTKIKTIAGGGAA